MDAVSMLAGRHQRSLVLAQGRRGDAKFCVLRQTRKRPCTHFCKLMLRTAHHQQHRGPRDNTTPPIFDRPTPRPQPRRWPPQRTSRRCSTPLPRTLRCSCRLRLTLAARTCRCTWSHTSGRLAQTVSMSSTLARPGTCILLQPIRLRRSIYAHCERICDSNCICSA